MPSLSLPKDRTVVMGKPLNMTLLPAGPGRIVHVIAKNLKSNLDTGTDLPVIGVRLQDNPQEVRVVRHAQILGPCDLWHTPENPLPGTDGRGVCVMTTTAAVRIFEDA